jgi:hypothetical protein
MDTDLGSQARLRWEWKASWIPPVLRDLQADIQVERCQPELPLVLEKNRRPCDPTALDEGPPLPALASRPLAI